MRLLTNSFKLQNTDLRWYRDKYLTAVFLISFLVALSLLWGWPPPHQDLIRGAQFLGVSALCLFVSRQRLFILASALSFIFISGLVGLVFNHSVGASVVVIAAGAAVYLLTKKGKTSLSPPYPINDYSYAELAVDCGLLGLLLWIYVRFIR